MKLNQDIVPSTIGEAVYTVVQCLTVDDLTFIENSKSPAEIHHTVGRYLRNSWSLWEKDTPLKQDAIKNYGLAHADDISGLILEWVYALIKNEKFNPNETCRRFHKHWEMMGTDSISAGDY